MKLLKIEDISKVSGGYENTSIAMSFNVPLTLAPAFAQSFPNFFEQHYVDLSAFLAVVQSSGLDPAQIQVEVDIYASSSI